MSSTSCSAPSVCIIDVHQLASVVKNRIENVLIIDCRSFIEYNACHVSTAVNVCCSKIVKRRLQQDKLSVKELIVHTCHCDVDSTFDIVVYDQQSKDLTNLPVDSFTAILLQKLQVAFRSVNLLCGGLTAFQEAYPDLCGDKVRKVPPLTSLSQPCLPIADQGPTRILPFLYLGSQFDALNKDLLKDHNITYELNVSTSCPTPDFLPEGHFMRIPVNDNYSEKLLPFFPDAFRFVDKAREGNGSVLIHCLAGISRSPTIAIAYVMRYLRLSSDDGYRYVKSKRPTISPNFNFLGQLLEFEKQLKREEILRDGTMHDEPSLTPLGGKKRLCKTDMRTAKLSLNIKTDINPNIFAQTSKAGEQSPTTALAKLSFSGPPTPEVISQPDSLHHSRSCESVLELSTNMKDNHSSSNNGANVTVLSPVKEIKCESLISEISTGQGDHQPVARSCISQWKFMRFCTREKRCGSTGSYHQICESKVFTNDKSSSNQTEIKCDLWRKPGKRESKFPFSFGANPTNIPKDNTSQCTKLLDRTKGIAKNQSESNLQPNSPNIFLSTYFPARSSYNRSDSATTSGFGSESSDWLDDNQTGRLSEISRIEFDLDELEDDVIVRSSNESNRTAFASRRSSSSVPFSLMLPNAPISTEWSQTVQSPLSPSESHLLEDLTSETSSGCHQPSGSTSPSISDQHFSEWSDNVQDSGLSSSSRWSLSRKRGATFDEQTFYSDSCSRADMSSKDKRKYKPLSSAIASMSHDQVVSSEYKSTKAMMFSEFSAPVKGDCDSSFCLYRVQSCPGISDHGRCDSGSMFCLAKAERRTSLKESSLDRELHMHSNHEENRKICSMKKDLIYGSESCPDVLHLGGPLTTVRSMPSSPHHRDFRKNVRLIRVS